MLFHLQEKVTEDAKKEVKESSSCSASFLVIVTSKLIQCFFGASEGTAEGVGWFQRQRRRRSWPGDGQGPAAQHFGQFKFPLLYLFYLCYSNFLSLSMSLSCL